jgi:hypothetical protein
MPLEEIEIKCALPLYHTAKNMRNWEESKCPGFVLVLIDKGGNSLAEMAVISVFIP